MKVRIQKWGHDLALRIPLSFAFEAGVGQDSEVDLTLIDGRLVLTPTAPTAPTLADLLRDVTPENLHGETDTGSPTGAEAW